MVAEGMKVGLTGQDRAPSCSLQRPANSVNLAPTGYTSLFTAAAPQHQRQHRTHHRHLTLYAHNGIEASHQRSTCHTQTHRRGIIILLLLAYPSAMPRSDEAQAFFFAVYSAVQEIPHGKVTSYGHIAKLVGTRASSILPPHTV